MKKTIFLFLFLLFPLLIIAQTDKRLNVTSAGTLGTLLTENEKATITNLYLTGVIDARDFKTIRDQIFELTVLDISKASIVAYSGTEGTYSSETTNYPANEIPAWAFHYADNTGKESLTFVYLPESTTAIGESAFDGCINIDIGGLPSSLTLIKYAAFYNCRSMNTLTIPAAVITIGEQAFSACGFLANVNENNQHYSSINGVLFNKNQTELLYFPGSLSGSYTIPSTVKIIGKLAFYWCNKLTSVTIPSTTTYIGNSAFEGCESLTAVNLPASLDSIGGSSFYYCMNLRNINIPASVKVIGLQALLGCPGPISVDAGNPNYSSSGGLLYNKTKSKLIQCPTSKTGTVQISSSVTDVEFYAFIGCACEVLVDVNHLNYSSADGILFNKSKSKLLFYPTSKVGSYKFPESVTYIGSWSFYDCQQLTSVTIPATVTKFGYGVFKQCYGLNSVYSQATTPIDLSFANYYYNNIFSGVNKESCVLYVPDGSKTLYQQADQWKDFTNIEEIKIVQVATAGSLGTMLTENEKASIANLSLSGVIDARDFKTIRGQMNSLAFLDIRKVTIVAYSGTEGTYSSETTNYPANEIPAWAFHYADNTGKESLNNVYLPESITAIGESAFDGCTNLNIGGLPQSLTHIKFSAFYNCRSMNSIIIPASVVKIEEQAFAACGFIVYVNDNNQHYSSFNGVLFNKNQTELLYYPGSIPGSYTVPSTVKTIGNLAFYWCNLLESVTIPSSTTYIGNSAFESCESLTSVTFPFSLDSIGTGAFYYCINLHNIYIPASVKVIGYQSLLGCPGPITVDAGNPNYSSSDGLLYNKTKSKLIQCPISKTGTVQIESSVTDVEFYAFIGCSCEVSVDENHLNYSSADGIMYNKTKSRLLFFPTSKTGSYTIPASVTYISSWSFYDCHQLTSVTIPPTVTKLGYGVFKQCYGLTSVNAQTTTPLDLSFSNFYYYNIFSGVDKVNCILYVPIGSKILYQQSDQWKDFQNIVEIATGISSKQVEEISIWPNPSIDYFYVQGIDDQSKLSIFDINGKKLLEKQVLGNEKVSITNLPKGLYIVRIVSNNTTIERKLIKK